MKASETYAEILKHLKSIMVPVPPSRPRDIKLAIEKFYDGDNLKGEEAFWLYEWFSRTLRTYDELYEILTRD